MISTHQLARQRPHGSINKTLSSHTYHQQIAHKQTGPNKDYKLQNANFNQKNITC